MTTTTSSSLHSLDSKNANDHHYYPHGRFRRRESGDRSAALCLALKELCDQESGPSNDQTSQQESPEPRQGSKSSSLSPTSPSVADVSGSPRSSSPPSSPASTTSLVSSPAASPRVPEASASDSPISVPFSPTSPPTSAAVNSHTASKLNIGRRKKQTQVKKNPYVCSGCGATDSSQWRNGPDGTKICNPCGMKFWRLKRKLKKHQQEEVQRQSRSAAANLPPSVGLHHHHHPQLSISAATAAVGLQQLQTLPIRPLSLSPFTIVPIPFPAAMPPTSTSAAQYFQPQTQWLVPSSQEYHQLPTASVQLRDANLDDETAAGLMMQRLRTASFSSLSHRSDSTAAQRSPFSSFSSLSSTPSSSFTWGSKIEEADGPTADERRRSSIYDILN